MSNKNETNKNETDSGNEPEARRTPAALLARSVQARFAAVARQAVALGLARAGAAEFVRITTGDFAHGFPEGSDYGALCEQDDLTKAQAEAIYHDAGQAVRAEAAHMRAGTDPEAAALITEQLAEWEEGAALEWAHMRETREKIDREDAEMDAQKEAEKKEAEKKEAEPEKPAESPAPRLYLNKPLTPGMEYVEDWLGVMPDNSFNEPFDAEWIAQNIDEGYFAVCPRCHFLHLPRLAWHLGIHLPMTVPVNNCDVCALLPAAAALPFRCDSLRKVLADAPAALEEARRDRARLLFEMWIGASCAADQWVLAEMEGALRRVEEAVKGGMPGGA